MVERISLILLLNNGERFLPKLLAVLDGQQGDFVLELIVVDCASDDQGPKLIGEFKGKKINQKKIFPIKQKDFSHGGTRNLAVQKATGEIVVFLSQDALPADKYWLQNLVNHFNNPQIAGVFGRQLPREQTNPIEKYFYSISYPQESRVIDQNSDLNFSNQNLFFSNVNAAARRDLLLKFPFRSDLVMSEDQYWGRVIINHGYQIIYESKAQVWHSHNYNYSQLFTRYFQSGYSQRQLSLAGNPFQRGIGTGLGFLGSILTTKPLLLPSVFFYLLIKGGAFLFGRKKILPQVWEEKLLNR